MILIMFNSVKNVINLASIVAERLKTIVPVVIQLQEEEQDG